MSYLDPPKSRCYTFDRWEKAKRLGYAVWHGISKANKLVCRQAPLTWYTGCSNCYYHCCKGKELSYRTLILPLL